MEEITKQVRELKNKLGYMPPKKELKNINSKLHRAIKRNKITIDKLKTL